MKFQTQRGCRGNQFGAKMLGIRRATVALLWFLSLIIPQQTRARSEERPKYSLSAQPLPSRSKRKNEDKVVR
jgi:hypothetical protein